MKTMRLLALAALTMAAASASAQIPLDYYSSLDGKCGAELKNAIYQIVGADPQISMLSYGSGNLKTWWAFYVTDRNPATNEVIDRYSYQTPQFGERGNSISGMNIEHSFPKSWWGGAENNAYKDLYNLMPCESSINQSKSNYPMGVVTRVTTAGGDNGCTRVGEGSDGKYWEPADQWKGDFARGYMYMATAYQNLTWSGTNALRILQQNSYPTLKPAAYELYLKWARADKVDQIETTRLEQVCAFQGNRNPYVDMPNLMEYVWGDSLARPLDLLTTLKSAPVYGTILTPEDVDRQIYSSTFLGTTGQCTIDYTARPSGFSVWTNSAQYGWVARGSSGPTSNITRYNTDASLITPVIDLTEVANAQFSFEHAVNFLKSPETVLSVLVRCEDDNTVTDLTDKVFWPAGVNWTFYRSGTIYLNRWAGHRISLIFRYTSTTADAATWEIRNLTVTARGTRSGIGRIDSMLDETDPRTLPAEYFSLDGLRVDPSTYRGIVIRRQGSRVSKHLLR